MYCVCCRDLDPIEGQGHAAFELPTTSEAVHAGGDDRSPLAGLSGFFFTVFALLHCCKQEEHFYTYMKNMFTSRK